jgi:hypothetical protein
MRRLVATSAVLATIAMNLALAQAAGGTSVSLAITATGNSFAGKVSSSTRGCTASRTVILKRRAPGAASFTKVGSDRTSKRGKWSVATSPVPGADYRVQVKRKTRTGASTCPGTQSASVRAQSTTVSLTPDAGSLSGLLTSPSAACRSARLVTLGRRTPYGTAFTVAGTATSGAGGAWTVAGAAVAGSSYRAHVTARQVGASACLPAVSTTRLPRVVHVAPTGSDEDPGTAAGPKLTIGAAVDEAALHPPSAVFVALGTYTGTVHLAGGVTVFGGFGPGWVPAAGTTKVVGVGEAVRADGVTTAGVERMTLEGTRAPGADSAYGVVAVGSALALRDVVVSSADGLAGADASASPSAPAAADAGEIGEPGAEDSSGLCSSAARPLGGDGGIGIGVSSGGAGGDAGHAENTGDDGDPGGGGAPGGLGVPTDGTAGPENAGAVGDPGDPGDPGPAGSAGAATYSADGFAPFDAQDGGVGAPGEGGGGGGGGGGGTDDCDSYGSSGGGGGAGGLPGSGGDGGASGGGSVAIFLWDSDLTLATSNVNAGDGGAGGDGADGQAGGEGGGGGSGGPYGGGGEQDDAPSGAAGGHGGAGGDGGAGGGGSGGPSVGVLLGAGSTVSGLSGSTVTPGTGGPGGSSSGFAGPAGVSSAQLTV